MAYLHENKEEFKTAVNLAAARFHILPTVVEKDYYVTMILRELSERIPFIVFKGGTSLSKCYKVIRRFSEDIDITIDTRITQTQMRHLKEAIQDAAGSLGLLIPNIFDTRSRRNYNRYILQYDAAAGLPDDALQPAVLLETSFSEISFPTALLPVHSYIGDMMQAEAPDVLKEFLLEPFEMKVQNLDRTLVDKIFAICDYYMENRAEKHSRHIYDIYKLSLLVPQNEDFRNLIKEVRLTRAQTNICPSAKPGVSVTELLSDIIRNDVYKKDYEFVTARLLEEPVSYEKAIEAVKEIAESGLFD